MSNLMEELIDVLNKHSAENASDTTDELVRVDMINVDRYCEVCGQLFKSSHGSRNKRCFWHLEEKEEDASSNQHD